MQGMPQPMFNYMPPMPTSFNPYATLPAAGTIPYPQAFAFPQAPGQFYGTYPGSYAHQIQQANYPHGQVPNQDPNQQRPYGGF
jgi:hypothetical protein